MTHEKLMEVIQMLIAELVKKHVGEGFESLSATLGEIKSELAELQLKPASLPVGSDEELNEQLTVLKSEKETLEISLEELQSSFNEKEALLSEKMALLSETQEKLEQLEIKSQDLASLEEKVTQLEGELAKANQSLVQAKEANRVLSANISVNKRGK